MGQLQPHWSELPKAKERDFTLIDELRAGRGVDYFDDMPKMHKAAYLAIAAAFPNVQVYACGSRVRGDYVDLFSSDYVHEAREAAGMKRKQESDYDFIVESHYQPVHPLPGYADRVTVPLPRSEMVAIPIFKPPY